MLKMCYLKNSKTFDSDSQHSAVAQIQDANTVCRNIKYTPFELLRCHFFDIQL